MISFGESKDENLGETWAPARFSRSSAAAGSDTGLAGQSVWMLAGMVGDSGDNFRQIVIEQSPFTIGRHADNNLTLTNPTVSGYHAEFLVVGDQLLLRDKNSTNGTMLNGRRIANVETLQEGDILHFGRIMFTLRRGREETDRTCTVASDVASEAIAQVQFRALLSRPGVLPYFQPIVDLHTRKRIAYEVLSRSQFIGLETPDKMFRVAAQRMSEGELSRICRLEGMRGACQLSGDLSYYLNTHPAELDQAELFESLYSLRELYPDQAVTLEVHEAGVPSVDFLRRLRNVLNELNIGLAYDDFGAGRARLTELIEVPPDVLKFDVQLVQGLPTASASRRSTVESLIRMVRDLNVIPLAEGVETDEEAEICLELGFELAQGFLFGRPHPPSFWKE